MTDPTVVSGEHNGVKYTVPQEAIDALHKLHTVDAIKEIKSIIDFELRDL